MNILHVAQNYYPSIGGTQSVMQNLAEIFVNDYNDEVTVFTSDSYIGPNKPQHQPIKVKEEVLNGVRIKRFSYYRFHFNAIRLLFKVLAKLSLPRPDVLSRYKTGPWSPAMIKAMGDGDYDVVMASSSEYLYMQYPLIRNKFRKPKPFLFFGAIHFAPDPKNDHVTQRQLESIKASEKYIANTAFEKERLIQKGIPADKITVIGTGIDLNLFATANGKAFREKHNMKDHIVLGFIGRQEKFKGVPMLMEAFATLANTYNNIYLLIAGAETTFTNEIRRWMATLDPAIQQRCSLLINLSQEDKIAAFHATDIFVSPSTEESFGIVFLEAWACKKPVIGADIGAVRSVISNNEDGYLVEPGNTQQLIDQLTTLINDSSLRQAMGVKGYEKVRTQFTWPVIAAKYRDLYQQAIIQFKQHKP